MKMLIDKVQKFERGDIVFYYQPSIVPEYNVVRVGKVSFSYDTPDGTFYELESIGGMANTLNHYRAEQLSRTFDEARTKALEQWTKLQIELAKDLLEQTEAKPL